jgi:RimJ/RimL family protein N-acetyltransferase
MSKAKKAEKAPLPITVSSPFPPDHLFDVWDWAAARLDKVSDDFGPSTRDEFIDRKLRESELVIQREVEGEIVTVPLVTTWGVWKGEKLGGYVSFHRDPFRVWMGEAHTIFRKDFWGWATTAPALVSVARQIFKVGIKKITMRPFQDNQAMHALIEHIGGVHEGTLRSETLRDGKLVNVKVYGLMQEELEIAIAKEGIQCL